MRRAQSIAASAAALTLFAAACSKPAAPTSSLSKDLDAASADAPALALTPNGSGTSVVSAIERAPDGRPAPRRSSPAAHFVRRDQPAVQAPVLAAPAPTQAPVVATVADRTPAPVPQTPSPVAQGPALPRQMPVQQQAPRGGWKTEAEVLSHAPFPITP